MPSYHSFLSIFITHEYFNSYENELAPFNIIPSQKTEQILKKYSILNRYNRGFIQLIADSDLFNDLTESMESFEMQFYLLSAEPSLRSITQMPNAFDIANINVDFVDNGTKKIIANDWFQRDQFIDIVGYKNIISFDSNIIAILNMNISKKAFNLDNKSIYVHFKTISTYWKYYLFSLKMRNELHIYHNTDNNISFTETENEQIFNKSAHIFISSKEIPLKKNYMESFTLMDNKKIIYKSLPFPDTRNLSTHLLGGDTISISHIYLDLF